MNYTFCIYATAFFLCILWFFGGNRSTVQTGKHGVGAGAPGAGQYHLPVVGDSADSVVVAAAARDAHEFLVKRNAGRVWPRSE